MYTEVTDVSIACPLCASPVKREWLSPAREAYGSRWWKRWCANFCTCVASHSVSHSLDKNLHQARWQRKKKGAIFLVKPACGRVGFCQEKVPRRRSLENILLTPEAHEQRTSHMLAMAHVSFSLGHDHLLCSRHGGLQGNVSRTSWCVCKAPAKHQELRKTLLCRPPWRLQSR